MLLDDIIFTGDREKDVLMRVCEGKGGGEARHMVNIIMCVVCVEDVESQG